MAIGLLHVYEPVTSLVASTLDIDFNQLELYPKDSQYARTVQMKCHVIHVVGELTQKCGKCNVGEMALHLRCTISLNSGSH